MSKKELILGLSIVLFLLFALDVSAGCCVNPALPAYICSDALTQIDCCAGMDVNNCPYYFEQSCGSAIGCYPEGDNRPVCFDNCEYVSGSGMYSTKLCADQSPAGWAMKSTTPPQCARGCCYLGYANVSMLAADNASCVADGGTFSLTSCDVNGPAGGFKVLGYVRDRSGQGIAGATVTGASSSALSGSDGAFTLNNMPDGQYTIYATKEDYTSGNAQVDVPQADSERVVITLDQLKLGRLEVTVLSGTNPFENAVVEISSASSIDKWATDASGKAIFPAVPIGNYKIKVYYKNPAGTFTYGYDETNTQEPSVFIGVGVTKKTFNLKPGAVVQLGTVSGTVTDDTGKLLPMAMVSLEPSNLFAYTDMTGMYKIDKVPNGTYVATAWLSGYLKQTQNVSIDEFDFNPTANFQLAPQTAGKQIKINFYNARSEFEVPDPITVSVYRVSDDGLVETKNTSGTGRNASITVLQNEEYRYVATKRGFKPVIISKKWSDDSSEPLTMELAPTFTMHGKISSAANIELSNVIAILTDVVSGEQIVQPIQIFDPYDVKGIPESKYTVRITANDHQDFEIVYPPQEISSATADSAGVVHKDFTLLPSNCTNGEAPVIESISAITGTPMFFIDYTVKCQPTDTVLQVCFAQGNGTCKPADFSPKLTGLQDKKTYPSTAVNFSVSDSDSGKKICFMLTSQFGFGTKFDSTVNCTKIGDKWCLHSKSQFCSEGATDEKDMPVKDPLSKDYISADRKYGYECDGNNTIKRIPKSLEYSSYNDPEICKSTDYVTAFSASENAGCKLKCRNVDAEKIEYYDIRASCRIQCNSVFGLFGYQGKVEYYKEFSQGTSACEAIDLCYKDYTAQVPDEYLDCSAIKSCYDYLSQAACAQNKCFKEQQCLWEDSPKYADLGIGVCIPKNETQQNCNVCSDYSANRKYNDLLSGCPASNYATSDFLETNEYSPASQISGENCKLYAGKGNCYYSKQNDVDASKACRNKPDFTCGIYNSKEDCGNTPVNVEVTFNVSTGKRDGTTNKILQRSNDWGSLGLCKWDDKRNVDFGQRKCFKDANGDGEEDCGDFWYSDCGKDMLAPVTVVYNYSGKLSQIDLPIKLYDDNITPAPFDLAKSYSPVQPTVYFSIVKKGEPFVYPYIDARTTALKTDMNRLRDDLATKNENRSDGEYTVYYYGADDANNLEEVKSFDVEIDNTPPEIKLNYTVDPNKNLFVMLQSNEQIRCSAKLTQMIGENNTFKKAAVAPEGNELEYSTPIEVNDLGEYKVIKKYAKGGKIADGLYIYNYTCKDDVGNFKSGSAYILTDSDGFMFNPQPIGIINHDDNVELSVETVENAECRYVKAKTTESNSKGISFDSMIRFSSTGGKRHTEPLPKLNIDHSLPVERYWIKCNYTSADNSTQKIVGQTSSIIFTVDKIYPKTYVLDPKSTDLGISKTPFMLDRWYRTADMKLGCSDDYDPTLVPKEFNFGCDEIYFCNDYRPCTPKPQGLKGEESKLIQQRVNSTSYICYFSQDKGGNTMVKAGLQPNCSFIRIDQVPPRADFTTNANSAGKVSALNLLYVFGKINNYAYWSDSFVKDVYYNFNDMVLTFKANGNNRATVKFNIGNSYYSAYIFSGPDENQIILYKELQAVTNPITIDKADGYVDVKITTKKSGNAENIEIQVGGKTLSYTDTVNPQYSGGISFEGDIKEIGVMDNSLSSPLDSVSIYIDDQIYTTLNSANFSIPVDLGFALANKTRIPGNTPFKISVVATDQAGNSHKVDKTIILDDAGPEAPILEPKLEEYSADNLPYKALGYPLKFRSGMFYTNDINLTISGYTKEPGNTLVFWTGRSAKLSVENSRYTEEYATMKDYKFTTLQDQVKGDTSIFVSSNIVSYPLVSQGNYIKFSSHDRTSYGNYKKFYQIKNVQYDGVKTKIELETPLEQDVKQNEGLVFYDKMTYSDKFVHNLKLREGNNFFYVQSVDDLGNLGKAIPSVPTNIYLDVAAPAFFAGTEYPANGSFIPFLVYPISFSFFDRGSGVSFWNFTIDGGVVPDTYKPTEQVVSSDARTGINETKYTMSFDPGQLGQGMHNLALTARDLAGNSFSYSWWFKIDNSAPGPFDVTYIDNEKKLYNASGDVLKDPTSGNYPLKYVSAMPSKFTIAYLDNLATIEFMSGKIVKNLQQVATVTCLPSPMSGNKNTFNCTVSGNLGAFEGDYTVEIQAAKVLTNNRRVTSSETFKFVYDTTAPNVNLTEYVDIANGDYDLPIEMLINNEAHGVFATINITGASGNTNTFIELTSDPQKQSKYSGALLSDFIPQLEDDYDVTITVSDYAGNTEVINKKLTIDKTPPTLGQLNVTTEPKYVYADTGDIVVRGNELKLSATGASPDIDFVAVARTADQPPLVVSDKCKSPAETNCITGTGSLNIDLTKLISGEDASKKRIALTLTFAVFDKAMNDMIFTKTFILDMAPPVVQTICIGPQCTSALPSQPKVTKIVDAIKSCTGPEDVQCYTEMIEQSCKDVKDQPPEMSGNLKPICYTSRIWKIASATKNPDIVYLCSNAGKYLADNCRWGVAVATKIVGVCSDIENNDTRRYCTEGKITPPDLSNYVNLTI